jgi:hypothetical protein
VVVAGVVGMAWLVGVSAYALVASNDGGPGGTGGGVPAFNACIRQSRFLLLVRHRAGHGIIETIRDRERGSLEGEVALARAPSVRRALRGEVPTGRPFPILGGAAAGNGPYIMSTITPTGRDPSAIERCWNGPFPTFG